ncbi:dihydrofolate reductase [Planoprotostelium fungivorum]|uniref:dihydrofolate reductase n=1 Tax=Planoprotostelium fungivorum TaxID=1890364 RepID=A0A2P6MSY0_9EUKA|nr:dihydrofolate reductase [Planoprotostelium fungivorum]
MSQEKTFDMIVAVCQGWGIGKHGTLPWRIRKDMQFFQSKTSTPPSPMKKNIVIMGRKTYDSIPPKFRPLPDRTNIILSRNTQLKESLPEGVIVCDSLPSALDCAYAIQDRGDVYVAGGGQVYRDGLTLSGEKRGYHCRNIFVTHIDKQYDCDAFFPDLSKPPHSSSFRLSNELERLPVEEDNGVQFRFATYSAETSGVSLHKKHQHLRESERQFNRQEESER